MNRPHSQAKLSSLFSVELPSFLVGTALIFYGNCPQAEMPSLLSVESALTPRCSLLIGV